MAATKKRPPAPFVLATLKKAKRKTGMALDLGAGTGRNALALTGKGFRVNAVDFSGASIRELKKYEKIGINPIKKNIKRFFIAPDFYDVIIAWNSLSFLLKRDATRVLRDIQRGLRPGGVVIVSIFGPHDEWAKTRRSMSFFTIEELKRIWSELTIVKVLERKGIGKGVLGDEKRWHVIQCVAGKSISSRHYNNVAIG